MRKLKIMEHISLDGVIQVSDGPGDGDFPYGDWTAPYLVHGLPVRRTGGVGASRLRVPVISRSRFMAHAAAAVPMLRNRGGGIPKNSQAKSCYFHLLHQSYPPLIHVIQQWRL